MEWFPSVFPHNVRCVVSAVTDSRSAVLLSDEHRTPPPVPLHVGELDESARQEIVKRTLGKYNKVCVKFYPSLIFSVSLPFSWLRRGKLSVCGGAGVLVEKGLIRNSATMTLTAAYRGGGWKDGTSCYHPKPGP